MRTLLVEGDNGRPFVVRMVEVGDRYGRDHEFVHAERAPLVEFYDARWPIDRALDGSVLGQFVERYAFAALCATADGRRPATTAGLKLSPYLDWALDIPARRRILDFLWQHFAPKVAAPREPAPLPIPGKCYPVFG